MSTKVRIGITVGDYAGIGPEIVDLALKSGRIPNSAEYVVIGRQPNCEPGDPTVETALRGQPANEGAFSRAADHLLRDAKGYAHNTFKIGLARRAIVRTLTQAAQATPQSQSIKKIR